MKRIFLILFVSIPLFHNILLASNQEDIYLVFQEANKYYTEGKYQQAVELYEKILSQGFKNKELLYNLGNAYYRLGEYHKSILYYERAKILDPFDDDINFNLQIANLHNVDKIQELPKFFLKQWWEDIRDSLASHQWAVVALISIWLASVSLVSFLFIISSKLRKFAFFSGLLFLVLFAISTTLGYSRYNFEINHNRAIIFTMNAYIKSSPEESSTDLFILHQGTKVEIVDELGDWFKIRLANGNIGWIKKSEVERI